MPPVPEEIGIDQGGNPSAQRRILLEVLCSEDLDPDSKVWGANQDSRIDPIAFARVWIFGTEPYIEALDEVPGEVIIDPRAIIVTEDNPGSALDSGSRAAGRCRGGP